MTGHNLSLPLLLSVSDVTRLIRESLEGQFREVWVEGEISNLRAPTSGHLYFTLKDAQSQIRGVLFRSGAARLRFVLQEGLSVVARGRISVYEPRGEYQLIVDALEPKGLGALQVAFEQLKERLSAEGLFEEARKRPLPAFPRTVGVVTSPTGAAIRDIVAVLRRRCPVADILLAPVPVQGEGAGEHIAAAIHALNEMPQVDVLIVGRGGGPRKTSGRSTTKRWCVPLPARGYRWSPLSDMKSTSHWQTLRLIIEPRPLPRRQRRWCRCSTRSWRDWVNWMVASVVSWTPGSRCSGIVWIG